MAFNWQSGGDMRGCELSDVPMALQREQTPAVLNGWRVRRLTPTECERLQGFPDGYTAVEYRGKPATDGPRYKALGNSMAVNVMRWIGHRIERVASLEVLKAEGLAA
jgi:DNA (cytosine-5)-methyltransferase 1